MAKLILNDIESLANVASAKQALNDNFAQLEAFADNSLSRDGSTPNQMEADIDLNNNDLLNVNKIDVQQLLKNGVSYEQLVSYGSVVFQLEDGTGAQKDYTLLYPPGSLGNLHVSVAGVMLRPGLDYSYTGQTLSFVVAPASGTDNILIRYAIALQLGSTNSADSKFIQTGAGAVERDMQAKGRESISIYDFDPHANGITDDRTAFINADAAAYARGKVLRIPEGTFLINSPIDGLKASWIAEPGATILAGSGVTLNGPSFLEWHESVGVEVSGLIVDFQSRPVTIGSEAVLGFRNPDRITLRNLVVQNLTGCGIAMNGVRDGLIEDCIVTRAAYSNNYNQALLISSAARQSRDLVVKHCRFINSGTDFACIRCTIRDCYISGWGFGAGITTEQDTANSNYYLIDSNSIDSSFGVDINLTVPMGIENWGADSVISNNVVSNCAGSGIDNGGQNTQVYSNTCLNNGQGTPSAGIVSRYGNATYNANGSMYWGNKCLDTQGSKTQTYGYVDQSSSLTHISIRGNDFNGNHLTGPELVQATVVDYMGPSFEFSLAWDPASIANGASTSVDVTCAGATFGDFVQAAFIANIDGCQISGHVKATNLVSVVLSNLTGGVRDLGSSTVRVRVQKPKNYAAF